MVATRSFSASQVRSVAPGMLLVRPVAVQARLVILLGAIEGLTLTPAGRYGAGWRDFAAQALFYDASRGNVSAIRKLRTLGTVIDSSMRTTVARPGTSSHGDSTRCDFLFNGRNADADDVAFMRQNQWVQEFGTSDRNHFAWTGTMSGQVSTKNKNRIVADWLNDQRLGKTTSTNRDGNWPAVSNMSWLLQTQGHEDGLYPTPRFKIDGEAGDRTRALRDIYASKLLG